MNQCLAIEEVSHYFCSITEILGPIVVVSRELWHSKILNLSKMIKDSSYPNHIKYGIGVVQDF